MPRYLIRTLSWIGAVAAICAGAVIAYYHRAPDDTDARDRIDVPPASAPATVEPESLEWAPAEATGTPAAPAPGNASAAPGSGDPAASGEKAQGEQTGSGRARSPSDRPGEAGAARLPEFFQSSLATDAPLESLEEGTPEALQARLQSEPRDEAWASRVEWQLENYLALQPHNETLGTPRVTCRSTVCRVITTTSKRDMARNPEADWHEMMAALQYESVSNEFSRSAETIVYNHAEPDRVGYVTYFERRRAGEP